MAVEAGRLALRAAPGVKPRGLYFATAAPAYLDKTNATAIHAALGLDDRRHGLRHGGLDPLGRRRPPGRARRRPSDPGGAVRSSHRPPRRGRRARQGRRRGGPPLRARRGWRPRPRRADRDGVGERRVPRSLARARRGLLAPVGGALRRARVRAAGPGRRRRGPEAGRRGRRAHRAGSSWRGRTAAPSGAWPRRSGAKPEALGDDLTGAIGNTGTAHGGLLLADALERAAPDEIIVLVSLADGADVVVWRTTGAVAARRPTATVAQRAASGGSVSYAAFLTWRGFLEREPPRRPDPEAPAGPPSFRAEAWKFGFVGQPVRGVRHAPRAAAAGVRQVPRRRPDDRRAHGRRAGDDRHLHGRSPGLLALAAGGGRGDRLRGRRALPVRADRRRPRGGGHRPARRDDLPPPLHRRAGCTTTSGRRGRRHDGESAPRSTRASRGLAGRSPLQGQRRT